MLDCRSRASRNLAKIRDLLKSAIVLQGGDKLFSVDESLD